MLHQPSVGMWWAFEEANAPMVVGLKGKLDANFMVHVRFDAVVQFEGETEDRWVFIDQLPLVFFTFATWSNHN